MRQRVALWWVPVAGAGGLFSGWAITSAFSAEWYWPDDAWSEIGSTMLAALAAFGASVVVVFLTRHGDRQDARDLRELDSVQEICRATLKLLDRLPNDVQLQRPGDWHGDWDDVVSLRSPAVLSTGPADLVQQMQEMFVAYRKRWLELSLARRTGSEPQRRELTKAELAHMGDVVDAYWQGLMDVTEELTRWSPRSKRTVTYVDVRAVLNDAYIPPGVSLG